MKIKLLFAAFIIAVVVYAFTRFDAQSFIDSVARIPLWSVALLAVVQIISQLLINLQWQAISKFSDITVSFRDMFYINSQAELFHFAPGGHVGCAISRAVQICKIGNCCGCKSAAIVATQKLFSFQPFFVIVLVAALFAVKDFYVHAVLVLLLAAVTLVFLIPRFFLSFVERMQEPRFAWLGKVKTFAQIALEQIISVRRSPRNYILLLSLSAFIWLLYPLKMYLLAAQVMPDVNFFYITSAIFVSYMFAMLPIFPGGLGGFEASMTGALVLIGFAAVDALALTVIFRFITFWFVLFLSLAYVLFHKIFLLRR